MNLDTVESLLAHLGESPWAQRAADELGRMTGRRLQVDPYGIWRWVWKHADMANVVELADILAKEQV